MTDAGQVGFEESVLVKILFNLSKFNKTRYVFTDCLKERKYELFLTQTSQHPASTFKHLDFWRFKIHKSNIVGSVGN